MTKIVIYFMIGTAFLLVTILYAMFIISRVHPEDSWEIVMPLGTMLSFLWRALVNWKK